MQLFLIGLPGSGRRTFVKELNKHYTIDFYDDFYEGEYVTSKANLKIGTLFSSFSKYIEYSSNLNNLKLLYVLFPTIYERNEDQRYSEFFGIDIRYIYDQGIEVKQLQKDQIIGTFGSITYDYNFNNFKKKLDKILSFDGDMYEEIRKILRDNNQEEAAKALITGMNIPVLGK